MIISILFIVVLGLGLTGVGGYQQKKQINTRLQRQREQQTLPVSEPVPLTPQAPQHKNATLNEDELPETAYNAASALLAKYDEFFADSNKMFVEFDIIIHAMTDAARDVADAANKSADAAKKSADAAKEVKVEGRELNTEAKKRHETAQNIHIEAQRVYDEKKNIERALLQLIKQRKQKRQAAT